MKEADDALFKQKLIKFLGMTFIYVILILGAFSLIFILS